MGVIGYGGAIVLILIAAMVIILLILSQLMGYLGRSKKRNIPFKSFSGGLIFLNCAILVTSFFIPSMGWIMEFVNFIALINIITLGLMFKKQHEITHNMDQSSDH